MHSSVCSLYVFVSLPQSVLCDVSFTQNYESACSRNP